MEMHKQQIQTLFHMADNNTDRHIEAKNAPSENKNRELRWRIRHYITKKKLRMHQEKIREETILKPDSDLFPTTIIF
jgi:dolichyl-phosphate-mannose--protein O-mannosyl transferase